MLVSRCCLVAYQGESGLRGCSLLTPLSSRVSLWSGTDILSAVERRSDRQALDADRVHADLTGRAWPRDAGDSTRS